MSEEQNIIHTKDPKMKNLLEVAESISTSKATVLIYGESGTGKELLARYIHAKSSRSQNRFVATNCAALPDGLLESELFGYERGAFTGANGKKDGKFVQADQSTYLLDEISELPLLLQSKLLRVIQEGEVEPLGSVIPKKVNVRLIATSNRDLSEMVNTKQFREDLFYRLNVIPLEIPPLRKRPKDIESLSDYFVDLSCSKNGLVHKTLGSDARKKLLTWSWPGNVRELQNVLERSVLLSRGNELNENDIQIKDYHLKTQPDQELKAGMTVSEAERLLILKTLEFTFQNRTKAAHLLGISIRTLRNKINEYKGENFL